MASVEPRAALEGDTVGFERPECCVRGQWPWADLHRTPRHPLHVPREGARAPMFCAGLSTKVRRQKQAKCLALGVQSTHGVFTHGNPTPETQEFCLCIGGRSCRERHSDFPIRSLLHYF